MCAIACFVFSRVACAGFLIIITFTNFVVFVGGVRGFLIITTVTSFVCRVVCTVIIN